MEQPHKLTPEEIERKARVAIDRAMRAKAIVEDPLFREAIAMVDAAIIAQWGNSGLKDEIDREKLWLMLQMGKRYLRALHGALDTGKLAERNLTTDQRKFWPSGV